MRNNPALRIIDANADRAAEGLRVVGDIARFVLDHREQAERWRSMRGRLWQALASVPGLQQEALESRDSVGDAGRTFSTPSHQDLLSVARTNIHRAQESFRVLEETLRAVYPALAPAFSELRYHCYDQEIILLGLLEDWACVKKLDFGLYVVLGREFSQGRDFVEVAEKAIEGGAGAIQLRDKTMSSRELLPWAGRLREITQQRGATFIINDRIDLALAVGADGVHLGQEDFPIPEARRILGPRSIIGASTHSVEEAMKAADEGASYINIGPIFATQTKEGAPKPVGPEMIDAVTAQVGIPFTVMGGIKLHNVDQALERGARRIALVTAVTAQDDIAAAAKAFADKIAASRQTKIEK